jgi:hypothetical protein
MNTDWSAIFSSLFPGHTLNDVLSVMLNLWQIAVIAIPISLLMYVMGQKYNHFIVVETGHHRWLVK